MQHFLAKVKRRVRALVNSPEPVVVTTPPSSGTAESLHYDDNASAEVLERIETLTRLNRDSERPVGDVANPVIVSVTTYGPRLARAFIALESIAQGAARPGRLVLTLSESDASQPLPVELQRLVSRGLQIVVVPDRFRVHSKYQGVLREALREQTPVVVADDDQLYPKLWLTELLAMHREYPDMVIAQRAHQVKCESETAIAPYAQWQPRVSTKPALSAFGTGVSGMLLPVNLLAVLADGTEDFLRLAPTADDIWLHSRAVTHGIRTVQVHEFSSNYEFVPGTQHVGLYLLNVRENANDPQISDCYNPNGIAELYAEINK